MKNPGISIRSKIRTIRDFRRRHGVVSTAVLMALQPLWGLGLFRAGHILCLRPEWVKEPRENGESSIEHRFLTDAEVSDLADPEKSGFPRYVSDLGIARHDPCFGSFVSGDLASVAWLAETPFVQWGSLLLFPEKYAFTHSQFTLPRFRGRRLQAKSYTSLVHAVKTRGYKGLLNTVDVTNPASIKGVKRAGFQKIGTVMQLGSRRRVFTFLSLKARRFGFFVDRSGVSPD